MLMFPFAFVAAKLFPVEMDPNVHVDPSFDAVIPGEPLSMLQVYKEGDEADPKEQVFRVGGVTDGA